MRQRSASNAELFDANLAAAFKIRYRMEKVNPVASDLFLRECDRIFPNLEIDIADDVDLAGNVVQRRVAGMDAIRIESPALLGRASRKRSTRLQARCKIVWQMEGSSVFTNDQQQVCLSAGDALHVPLGEAYSLDVLTGYRAVMLVIPERHTILASLPSGRDIRLITGNSAMKAAGAVVSCLFDDDDQESCGPHLLQAAFDLIRGPLSNRLGTIAERRYARRARHHIEAHLADRYTPNDLARDMGMSRRALYAALAAEGESPAKLIRLVRLESARRCLMDDSQRDLSLGEIALRAGLNDGAALSRAFRAEFGTTPSAVRDTAVSFA